MKRMETKYMTLYYIVFCFFLWEVIFLLAGLVAFKAFIMENKRRIAWVLEGIVAWATAFAGIKLYSLAITGKTLWGITPHLAGMAWWLSNIFILAIMEWIISDNKKSLGEARQ